MTRTQRRVGGAFLLGAVIIGAALFLRTQKEITLQSASAAAVEREFIPVTDADNNGVADWQDALNSVPITIEATSSAASSTYEKPTTVTGKFAVKFFEDLLRSKMYGSFGKSPDAQISSAAQELAAQAQDELLTEKDISVLRMRDQETLRIYSNNVASILLAHHTGNENEAVILQDALRSNDPKRLEDLKPITAAYTDMVKNLLDVEVPEGYEQKHLDLLNALNALKEDVRAMEEVNTDPLYTFLRVKRYQDDVLGMTHAVSNLFNTLYLQDNIHWADGESAARVYGLMQDIGI
jgi:hypothetical protein